MTKIITGTLLAVALVTASEDISPVEEQVVVPMNTYEGSSWEQQLVIYGWMPTFDGTITYQIPSESDKESDASMIDNLDMALMGSYEARKDKFSFLTDLIYLGMSGEETVRSGTLLETTFDQELTAWLLSFYGGYNIIDAPQVTLDLIAGMRYFSLDIDAGINLPGTGLPTISLSPSVEVYDALIGIKGRVDINQNWYIPYIFDIGMGDTDLTWQAQASIGYRFGWGDVLVTYRYMHYEKEGLSLIQDFNLYGPKVGVVFHF